MRAMSFCFGLKKKLAFGKRGDYSMTLTTIKGIKVGHATDRTARTGCTVILTEDGAVAGVDVRGAAPGTRETDLLKPGSLIEKVHGILLTGGSAYGLDAAAGMIEFLERKGVGYKTGEAVVPIIPGAVLYDLAVGTPNIRPDKRMGYQACKNATSQPVEEGLVGAGTGATVGKVLGMERSSPGGIGSYALELQPGVWVASYMVVNAYGQVVDEKGNILAGVRSDRPGEYLDGYHALKNHEANAFAGTNTTIGVVATNAALSKEQANRVASIAHNGIARSITPAHTMYDGDTIFCLSTGEEKVNLSLLGESAAMVVTESIRRAVIISKKQRSN